MKKKVKVEPTNSFSNPGIELIMMIMNEVDAELMMMMMKLVIIMISQASINTNGKSENASNKAIKTKRKMCENLKKK